MIPREVVDEILSRADIVEVISSYIPVDKKGNAYRAVCPFHADTNPSLNISRSKKIYKCFACGKGGNVFSFVSDYEKIPYVDAIKRVASLISYDDKSLHENISYNKNNTLYQALNTAKDFYHYTTKTNIGIKAQEYFKKRNIDEKMQDYFSLGYSPSNSSLVIKTLNSKGYDILTLDKIGITFRENGEIIDRFNSRIMFPIFNEDENVIGFSGRIIEGDGAKYVNTSSTVLFNKSEALYNYNNAKKEARIHKYVYVVEGFMDVFALYKANITSSVALMGTAFTAFHAKMLRKLNAEVRIMLDGDDAGQNGTTKMISILQKEQIPFKVVNYNDSLLDPDEILNQFGIEKLQSIANDLLSGTDFLIKHYKKRLNLKSIEGKKEFLSTLAIHIKYFKTNLEKENYLKLLAKECDSSYESTLEYVRELIKINSSEKEKHDKTILEPIRIKNKQKKSAIINAERGLIIQMLNNNLAIEDFLKNPNSHFDDDIYGILYNYILDAYQDHVPVDASTLINKLMEDKNKNQELIDILLDLSYDEDILDYDEEIIKEYILALDKSIKNRDNKNIDKQIIKTSSSPLDAAKKLKEKRGS